MDKLKMHSPDLTQGNIEKIAELFPTVITEGRDDDGNPVRVVDFELLRQELSDHVVEGPQERYQLDWPGKREALFAANAPIAKTLRPVREESVDFNTTQNLFIEGDNLDALKLIQESYLGKVKLIYIDPPYNTGNDFVYNDDFSETTNEYLTKSGQVDDAGNRLVANTESNGRFHSDWLSMMFSRLKLSRSLLADDGFICVSIDDNEQDNLRKLCGQVFGEKNFVVQFIWRKGGTGKNDSRHAIIEHEYVLVYARSLASSAFGIDSDATVSTKYNRKDERGNYSLVRLDSKTLGYVPTLDFEILDAVDASYFPEQPDGKSEVARWRWSRTKVEQEHSSLVFERGFVYTKNYEQEGARPRSLLIDERFGVTRTGKKNAEDAIGIQGVFDYPKPVSLVEFLLRITDDKHALVMDFFAGSGTTAQAVMQLNARDGGSRRFIMVQLGEQVSVESAAAEAGYSTIAELSRQRIKRSGAKIRDEAGLAVDSLDLGFRVLYVDTTNMADILRTPDALGQDELDLYTDSVKPDRTGEDLLFQVLLDWGLELTMRIAVDKIDGLEVFVVEDGVLVACFEPEVSQALVREIASRKPLRAVFLDAGFATDADRINAEQVFAELSPATDVKAI